MGASTCIYCATRSGFIGLQGCRVRARGVADLYYTSHPMSDHTSLPRSAFLQGETPPEDVHPPGVSAFGHAESVLQRRMEFEAMVSRISSLFIGLRTSDLDWGIDETLKLIGPFLGVDRCYISVIHAQADLMDFSNGWSMDGSPTPWEGRVNIPIDRLMPWAANRLRRLEGIAVYSVADLSPEAAVDQVTFRTARMDAFLFLPMAAQGELAGFIGVDSTRGEMEWTDDAVNLLKFAATLLGDSLDRRRIEEKMRNEHDFTNALLSAAGAVIIVTDTDGQIIRFNAAAEAISGFSAEQAVGQTPWELFIARDERASGRRIFRKVAAGEPGQAYEGTLIRSDGETRTISWSVTSILGEEGQVNFIILSGIDVSETKRLEAEVLNVAEREQSRIGHDLHDGLGQTLTGIEFMSHVLHQRLANQNHPEAAEMEQITSLIRDAIRTTRDLARGLSPVLLQSKGLSIALNDLAESTTRQMRGVRCNCQTDSHVPETPPDIAIHLYRIAQEAVNNATRHGKATVVTISLRLYDTMLELLIEDNGQGFPDNFDFGTGMGLRVMHYRAGIIRGNLQINQHPGEGVSIVCLMDSSRLPLKGVG